MRCSLLTLSSYLDSELEARRRGEVEAHLVGCQRCRAGLGHLREDAERITALAQVGISDELATRILQETGVLAPDEVMPAAADQPISPPWFDHAPAPAPQGGLPPVLIPPAPRAPSPGEHAFDLLGSRAAEPAHVPSPPEVEDGTEPEPEWAAEPAAQMPEETEQPAALETPQLPLDHPEPAVAGLTPMSAAALPPPALEPPPGTHQPAAGETTVPNSPSWSPAPPELDEAPTLYPLTDEDVLAEPAPLERFRGGPVPAPRPGLIGRIREQIAVRRALTRRHAAGEESIEIVSGAGAPARRGWARVEAEPPPAMPPHVPPAPAPPGAGLPPAAHGPLATGDEAAPSWTPDEDEAEIEMAGERVSGPALFQPMAGYEDMRPSGLRDSLNAGIGEPAMAEAAMAPEAPSSAAPPRPLIESSPSELRDGRRLLALFGAAVLVMFVVGLKSGQSTAPAPTAQSTTAPAPAQAAHPSAAPSHGATASKPPSLAPTAPVAPPASALSATQSLGGGGHGFQVRGLRYGVHPGDFRVVFDLAPAAPDAAGIPAATVGQLDPTTLVVAFAGVIPAGGTGQLPTSNPVASVSLLPNSPIPGTTAYQFKLAHPVQVKAYYTDSPLRLVLDLG
jgi:hypothetical protein